MTIEDRTIFRLEFSLKDLHELLALQVPSQLLGGSSRIETSTRLADSRPSATQVKRAWLVLRQQGKRSTLTLRDDVKLVDLK